MGGRGSGSRMTSGSSSSGSRQVSMQTNQGPVSVNINSQSAKQEADAYFNWLDKGTARMQAETWAKGNQDNSVSAWMVERNTVQRMVNSSGNNTSRGNVSWDDYQNSTTASQRNIIRNAIQNAARDYINKDKQTKAGARYWKKIGL